MNQIILTTPEELRAIVSESVSQTLAGLTLPKTNPTTSRRMRLWGCSNSTGS